MGSNVPSTFDGNSILSMTMSNYNPSLYTEPPGLFLGNGKVGFQTGFSASNSIDQVFITATSSSTTTKYSTNTFDSFNTFQNSFKDYPSVIDTQSLDTQTAIFNTTSTATGVSDSLSISTDYYCPRNMPFCTMQTIRITPSTSNILPLNWTHTVAAPTTYQANMGSVEYNNNVIYDNIGNQPIYIITGKSIIKNGLQDTILSFASSYIFENCTLTTNLGFNVFIDDPHKAFNYFSIVPTPSTTARIHIITSHMTSYDFDNPNEEVKRVVLSVINRSVTQVRTSHVSDWQRIWNSCITITPKIGITLLESDSIKRFQRYLKTALYQVFSAVRDGINLDTNPSTYGIIDRMGSVLYSGDLSIIPLLTLIKPELARSVFDYRFKTLGIASQLAAGYGYAGAKFPYEDDRLGYKNALYWNTSSNLTIFNTALVSINTWNYYRTTKDLQWLRTTGYPIIRSIAEFFESIIQRDSTGLESFNMPDYSCCSSSAQPPPSQPGIDIAIQNVVSITGLLSIKNNTFTNTVVKLALRYAMEASYELSTSFPDIWQDMYQGLPIPTYVSGPYAILKRDEAVTDVETDSSIIPIPEPLLPFIPYLSDETKKKHENVAYIGLTYPTMIENNFTNYYIGTPSSNPLNLYIYSAISGNVLQGNPSLDSYFTNNLLNFINLVPVGPWAMFNDITTASYYALSILQGICQYTFVGGVAQSRFYYQELGVTSLTTAIMPNTWRSITVSSSKNGARTTYNSAYYP